MLICIKNKSGRGACQRIRNLVTSVTFLRQWRNAINSIRLIFMLLVNQFLYFSVFLSFTIHTRIRGEGQCMSHREISYYQFAVLCARMLRDNLRLVKICLPSVHLCSVCRWLLCKTCSLCIFLFASNLSVLFPPIGSL